MASYPALHVSGIDGDLALASVDDWSPVAAESVSDDSLTIYFTASEPRDAAARALAEAWPAATLTSLEIDDEDWARRSQENLGSVVVGRVTIRPGDSERPETASQQEPAGEGPIDLVIQPSMGFGTGHHATTRLCLAALQRLDLKGLAMLDIGTGSGVLALAARALGATEARGLDYDPDAIQSACENLTLNPQLDAVGFSRSDLTADPTLPADVVTANLTGALLCRAAPIVIAAVRPGGHLILSGILDSERDDVVNAFSGMALSWETREDEWVALGFVARVGQKT